MTGLGKRVGIVAAVALAIAATALAGVNGSTHTVAGTLQLNGVACPPTGTCVAVGQSPTNVQRRGTGDFVQVAADGKPGVVHQVQGTSELDGVACPGNNYCIATGANRDAAGSHKAVYVVISNGRAGTPHPLEIDAAASVGCGSATSCWIVGEDFPPSGNTVTPVVVHIVDGRIAQDYPQTGDYTFGSGAAPACFSPSSCLLTGQSNPVANGPGLVLSLDHGQVKVLDTIKQTSGIPGLDCTSQYFCTLGAFLNYGAGYTHDYVLTLRPSGPGPLQPVSVGVTTVACRAADACFGFGMVTGSDPSRFAVVPIDNGKPGALTQIHDFIFGSTCQGSACLGVGLQGSPSRGVVFSFRG